MMYEKKLSEKELCRAVANRTRNQITELHINNVWLESQMPTKPKSDAVLMARQIRQNRKDIEEATRFAAFLDELGKRVKNGQFDHAEDTGTIEYHA